MTHNAPDNRKRFILILCAGFAVAILAASFLYRLDNPSLQEPSRAAQRGGMPPQAGGGAMGSAGGGQGGMPPQGMDKKGMQMIQGLMQKLSENPNDPETLRTAGQAFMRMGSMDQAEALLSRALVAAPADVQTMYLLGIVHFDKKEPEKAAGYFETIRGIEPENVHASFNLAMLYKHYLKKPDEAHGILEELAKREDLSDSLRDSVNKELGEKD